MDKTVNPPTSNDLQIALTINGQRHTLTVEPWVILLDLLRDNIGLTGTKKGCDHGQCGACTVLVNGKRINSCLALAVTKEGAEITTIEGFASGQRLASSTNRVRAARRLPMWILYAWTDLLGPRLTRRRSRQNPR